MIRTANLPPTRPARLLAAAVLSLAALVGSPCRAADDDAPPPISPAGTGAAGPAAVPPATAEAPGQAAADLSRAAPQPVSKPQKDVQIEQKHVGRRLSEVIVTPAGFTYQYTMVNLEGQDSGSVLQPHPGLSIPRFFRFDF